MDYIFPDFVAKILKKPSERTQLEASLVGITCMILGSLGIAIYFIFFSEVNVWFKILIGLSGMGFFLFQFSTLATTYLQYFMLKSALGLYPEDYKLKLKVNEAKELVKELNKLIEKDGNKSK